MVTSTAIELKPRGIIELFDQAIRLYRNNFLKFVGIIAVAQVPLQLIQLIINVFFYSSIINSSTSDYTALTAMSTGTSLITVVVGVLSFIFVTGLATAALTRAIVDSYLGEEVSIQGSYEKIKGSWGSLLGAMLLVALLSIPLMIWFMVPCIGWFTGLGMLFFAGIVVSPLIAPIIVIERRDATNAIRRAWEMARRRFWWLVGFFMLLMLFNLLVVQGPVQIVAMWLQSSLLQGASAANLASTTALQSISTSVLTLFLSLLYLPLAATCATLAYFDLRIRQEGFDLALMASQDSEAPVNALELAAHAPAIPDGPLVTKEELSYFVLISLMAVAIYFIVFALLMGAFMAAMGPTYLP